MTDAIPKLAWKGVSKRFEGRAVLDGLDLSVAAGQVAGHHRRLGPGQVGDDQDRAGPDAPGRRQDRAGRQEHRGPVRRRKRRKLFSRVGVLFQGAALFDSLTIWENVAFRLINADGIPRKEAKERAIEALEQVRLAADVADRFPSELSGGMQKRAGLARAVVAQPEILFFDEPTTGLDPITAAAINELISDQVRRLGSTAVSITHDLASAQTIGDEIAMLHGGRIIWRGPAAELRTTDNPYVRQFVEGRAEGPISHAV
jgi:phospholipid/cholesterol/gamma-HCH transport system ATP-binding protein